MRRLIFRLILKYLIYLRIFLGKFNEFSIWVSPIIADVLHNSRESGFLYYFFLLEGKLPESFKNKWLKDDFFVVCLFFCFFICYTLYTIFPWGIFGYAWLLCVHSRYNIFNYVDFPLSFQDAATVYAHAMIDLHDLAMWYIFLVLGVVYWSLYAILRNCIWRLGNKELSPFNRLFFSFFFFIESVLVFIWSYFLVLCAPYIYQRLRRDDLVEPIVLYLMGLEFSYEAEIFYFIYGRKYLVRGLAFPRLLMQRLRWPFVQPILLDKYVDHFLFSFSSYGETFYDGYPETIQVRRFRHSFFLEVIWASFPTIIILLILIPSLYLIYSAEEELDPEFTLKVIGHQWFWSYEYSDFFSFRFGSYRGVEFREFNFDSFLVLEEDLPLGSRRLLEVSNRVVLPTNIVLRFLITSGDVLHSWAVPEMGIKMDAVPGRLNQCISILLRPGVFYGQCSELCGVAHGFMPIVVHSVSPQEFEYWSFWAA